MDDSGTADLYPDNLKNLCSDCANASELSDCDESMPFNTDMHDPSSRRGNVRAGSNTPFSDCLGIAIAMGKKRQSAKTGFVHCFPMEEEAWDAIPVFENFCYAFALIRRRTVDSVLEGKRLLERLLAFQTPEGGFPVYLHDFPRCYDRWMGLKAAPIFVHILKKYDQGLGDLKTSLYRAVMKIFRTARHEEKPPLWEHRWQALLGKKTHFLPEGGAQEWYHWLMSEQLLCGETAFSCIPYHSGLQLFLGGCEVQEWGEPKATALEWALAESEGLSPRLLRPCFAVLAAAALFPVKPSVEAAQPKDYAWVSDRAGARLYWKGSRVHSLSAPGGILEEEGARIAFSLDAPFDGGKREAAEASLFCNLSKETEIWIEGKKGTLFRLGDQISLCTPLFRLEIRFVLDDPEAGEFCGRISRANRPAEIGCRGGLVYEAFDWHLALRTLRRTRPCRIHVEVSMLRTERGTVYT